METNELTRPEVTGDFTRYPLPRLLYYLYKKMFVGVLVVKPSPTATSIQVFFRQGYVVESDALVAEDGLPQILLERGWISHEQFFSLLQETAQGGTQAQLLLRLQGQTTPSKTTLVEALRLQLRRKANRLFHLRQAAFDLFATDHPHTGAYQDLSVRLDPLAVIHQGVKNTFDEPKMAAELAKLDNKQIRIHPERVGQLSRYAFTPEEDGLVTLLQRSALPIHELYRVSNLGPLETKMLVYTLWVTEALMTQTASETAKANTHSSPVTPSVRQRPATAPQVAVLAQQYAKVGQTPRSSMESLIDDAVIELGGSTTTTFSTSASYPAVARPGTQSHPGVASGGGARRPSGAVATAAMAEELKKAIAEAHSNLTEKTHYQILNVDPKADRETIRNAYFSLAKRFHPDKVKALGITEVSAQAEELLRRINEAHGVLIDAAQRKQYDEACESGGDMSSAAMAILQAEMEFQKGMVWVRKKGFAQARQHFAEALKLNPNEADHLAWTAWSTLNDRQLNIAPLLPALMDQLQQAIALSPKNADYLYYLGEVYLAAQEPKRAEQFFRKALELKPEHFESQRQVRFLQMRKKNQPSGGTDTKNPGGGLFGMLRKK